jgi:hypothetical protein
LFILLTTSNLSAQTLSLRLTTSAYSWEVHPSLTSSETQVRGFQQAQLTVGKLGNPNLSFTAFWQSAANLAGADMAPLHRLYNAYFRWRRLAKRVDLRLGRQRLYDGVAYGTVDGLRASVRLPGDIELVGFAGLLVPLSRKVEIGSWDDGHLFGGRVKLMNLAGARASISYMRRSRSLAYLRPGRFSQRILVFTDRQQELAGLDVQRAFGRQLSLYGRFDWDFEQERVRRAEVEMRVNPSDRLELSGVFIHRAPLIDANSIFTVFDSYTTQELLVRAAYAFRPGLSVFARTARLWYNGDNGFRAAVGLQTRYGTLGFEHRSGYGGSSNGLTGSLAYPLRPGLALIAGTGFSSYRLFDDTGDYDLSLTGSLGVQYRPNRKLTIDLRGHGLRNKFFKNDMRVFLRVSYWLFVS